MTEDIIGWIMVLPWVVALVFVLMGAAVPIHYGLQDRDARRRELDEEIAWRRELDEERLAETLRRTITKA